ncbi:MAG: LysE family transporter [Candidatus Puniceispirillum sp.]|nr:LysE family transporter [Candidatus Puniceispirillum sp.]
MIETIAGYWPGLMTIYIASFLGFVSPGPNFVVITAHAVKNRRAGVATALGVSFGTAIWVMLTSTGMMTLLNAYEETTLMVGLVGGSYLCWLGVKSLRAALSGTKFSDEFNKPQTPSLVIAAMVAGCFAISLSWHMVLALVFSTGSIRQTYISFKSVISAIFGTLFIGFGLKVIHSVIAGK